MNKKKIPNTKMKRVNNISVHVNLNLIKHYLKHIEKIKINSNKNNKIKKLKYLLLVKLVLQN